MDFSSLVAESGVYVATFLVCLASGLIPVINAELFLLGLALLAPGFAVGPVLLLATAGQMAAKAIMYFAGRGAVHMPSERLQRALAASPALLDRWKGSVSTLLLVSALTGFPPFFVVTIAAGAARVHFARFMVLGFIGRLGRFALVLLFPNWLQSVAQLARI